MLFVDREKPIGGFPRDRAGQLLSSRRFWLACVLLGCALFCVAGPLRVLFDYEALTRSLQQAPLEVASLAFVVAYALATVLGIPGTLLTIAGGVAFGLFWGTLLSVTGATVGAMGAFWVARYLLRDRAERKFGRHRAIARFQAAVARKPFQFVLAVRFAPISPFNVVNFLFGLTPISAKPYFFGTFFGIIPGTLAYTWLGVTGERAFHDGEIVPLFVALFFLAILCLLPAIARRRSK